MIHPEYIRRAKQDGNTHMPIRERVIALLLSEHPHLCPFDLARMVYHYFSVTDATDHHQEADNAA